MLSREKVENSELYILSAEKGVEGVYSEESCLNTANLASLGYFSASVIYITILQKCFANTIVGFWGWQILNSDI